MTSLDSCLILPTAVVCSPAIACHLASSSPRRYHCPGRKRKVHAGHHHHATSAPDMPVAAFPYPAQVVPVQAAVLGHCHHVSTPASPFCHLPQTAFALTSVTRSWKIRGYLVEAAASATTLPMQQVEATSGVMPMPGKIDFSPLSFGGSLLVFLGLQECVHPPPLF